MLCLGCTARDRAHASLCFDVQGTHTAMKSGMLAAEATFEALKDDTVKSGDISAYQTVRLLGWCLLGRLCDAVESGGNSFSFHTAVTSRFLDWGIVCAWLKLAGATWGPFPVYLSPCAV